MEAFVDFTGGLTTEISFPWLIAVYLFFAGISGGALGLTLLMGKLRHQSQDTPVFKAASILSLVTIGLGMICLVVDLVEPLNFWRILVFFNVTSVMSLGVMVLNLYIPITLILVLIAFREEFSFIPKLEILARLGHWLNRWRSFFTWVGLVLAFVICAYTGFLISALVRFPLINTSVLPALFVASGLSAGAAATRLVATALFGANHHDPEMVVLHKAEWPIMAAEVFCLLMIVVGLLMGYAGSQVTAMAFTTGMWATVFWVGVVGVGFVVPIVVHFVTRAHSMTAFWLSGLAAVAGMMCLRLFILYSGQMHSVMHVPLT